MLLGIPRWLFHLRLHRGLTILSMNIDLFLLELVVDIDIAPGLTMRLPPQDTRLILPEKASCGGA